MPGIHRQTPNGPEAQRTLTLPLASIAYFAGWRTLIRSDAIVAAVCFAGAVGIFFGFYPAQRASRLHSIEALS